MELPGRAQGNPGSSLWAAEVAHGYAWRCDGEGIFIKAKLKNLRGRSYISYNRKICWFNLSGNK